MDHNSLNTTEQQELLQQEGKAPEPTYSQGQPMEQQQYNGYQQPVYNQQPQQQYNAQYQQQPQYAQQPMQPQYAQQPMQPQYAQQPMQPQYAQQPYQGQPQPQQQVIVTEQVTVQTKNQGAPALPGMHFEDPSDRLGFIRKVYLILTAQLAFTAGFVALAMTNDTVKEWIWWNLWMYGPVVFTLLFTEIALICNRRLARKVPINYIFLFLFTFAEAYLVAMICITYSVRDVIFATTVTAGMVIGLTVYAFKTKADFTVLGGLLWIISFSLFFMAWFWIFWPVSTLMYQFFCVLVICLFGIYLIYDTQLVVGKGRYKLQIDDYILGAMVLYADIITIFLYILALFGRR